MIQTSHAIKASCKLVFNALCHDTSRFFKGVGECFSVHSWLAKRGYRLVKIDTEESSPSNAQKKSEVKQITCESREAGNEENSSLIVSPATEAPDAEEPASTVQETQHEDIGVQTVEEKSSEVSKTATSQNTAPVPAEAVEQTSTEEPSKISREVANPDLQQKLVQRLNEAVEKSDIHPEKLADMEMDAELKRLASLKNKDKSDNLSDSKSSQEAMARSQENAAANVVQQTGPSSSSNVQSKSDKLSDSKNPSVDSPSETSSVSDAEKPKAKRGRKKKVDTQTANAAENAVTAPKVEQPENQEASNKAKKSASAAKPKANTAASNQPKSNAAPSDQNPPKAKRGRKPKALQSANSQASNAAAKSKEVSVVPTAKANKTAKTAKSAAQTKTSVKPAAKTTKATTQAKAEVKPMSKTPAKTPSLGKSSANAIQAPSFS